MRSGYTSINNGYLQAIGVNSNAWSGVAAALNSDTLATAYLLHLNSSATYPSNLPDRRWLGFPLRWLQTKLLCPLYYVRSGDILINNGTLHYPGSTSYAWSSTASTLISFGQTQAYFSYLNESGVYPSNGLTDRYNAFLLR